MRYCGNCEWCIKPEQEDEIKKEQGYEDTDLNIPLAGDCSIGMTHNNNYYCKEHTYIEGLSKAYVLYDEKYLGPGYFIIMEYSGEPVIFIKMYEINNMLFPYFKIRAYEKDNHDSSNKEFKNIELTIYRNNNPKLYEAIKLLLQSLPNNKINNLDHNEGKNNISIKVDDNSAIIIVSKDKYNNQKSNSNYIDITLGDPYTCKYYIQLGSFYSRLSTISDGKIKEDNIKRMLKLK